MVHLRGWHELKLSEICGGIQGCQSKKNNKEPKGSQPWNPGCLVCYVSNHFNQMLM